MAASVRSGGSHPRGLGPASRQTYAHPSTAAWSSVLRMERTWDGLPVAPEKPFASCVVVWRDGTRGREYLLLHRHHEGPEYEGDWAWTPPSGARQPRETPDEAAGRELLEETGLTLPLERLESPNDEVALYVARAPSDAQIVLDVEHDRFEWLPRDEAVGRCLPARVGACITRAAAR